MSNASATFSESGNSCLSLFLLFIYFKQNHTLNIPFSLKYNIFLKKLFESSLTFCCCFFEGTNICFQSSSLVELCDIFPSRINGKIFQFQGKINKAFIATTELTFGKFFEMFSTRFAFKLFKLGRQTYPFQT